MIKTLLVRAFISMVILVFGIMIPIAIGQLNGTGPLPDLTGLHEEEAINILSKENTVNNSTPIVEIYTPNENEYVNRSVVIKGRISPTLGDDDYIWIGAKPYKDIKNWWPQENGRIVPFKGGYFEGNAFLGGNSGDKIEIGIFIVNQSLNEKLNNWLNFTIQYNVWPPITKNNPGATISKEVLEEHKYANVTVMLNNPEFEGANI
jgi:hypothetical protein